jgi:murein DD-endopeptidase MepM/ murein hydrolase activator NlpD
MPSGVPSLMKMTAQIMPNIKDWNLKKSNADKDSLTLAWPVRGYVSSGFGPRGMGSGGRWRVHEGLDIPVPKGTPVQAAMDGVVVEARTYNGYGNTVIVAHANNVRTLYAHCSEIVVKKGQQVEAGQMVAYSGNTGRSTTPHVHFGVMVSGVFCDPSTLLKYPAQHFVYKPSDGRD